MVVGWLLMKIQLYVVQTNKDRQFTSIIQPQFTLICNLVASFDRERGGGGDVTHTLVIIKQSLKIRVK